MCLLRNSSIRAGQFSYGTRDQKPKFKRFLGMNQWEGWKEWPVWYCIWNPKLINGKHDTMHWFLSFQFYDLCDIYHWKDTFRINQRRELYKLSHKSNRNNECVETYQKKRYKAYFMWTNVNDPNGKSHPRYTALMIVSLFICLYWLFAKHLIGFRECLSTLFFPFISFQSLDLYYQSHCGSMAK